MKNPSQTVTRPAWVMILVFLGVAVLQVVAGFAVWIAWPDRAGVGDTIPAGLLVASAAVTSAVFLAAALAMGRLIDPDPLRALSAGRPPGGWGMLPLAVLAFVPLSFALDALLEVTGLEEAGVLGLMTRSLAEARGMTLLLAIVFIGGGAGIAEECFFRGTMQGWLRGAWGPRRAIVASSAAFGAMHMDPVQASAAFCFGLLLGWMVERTGSLSPAIAAHAANNTVSVLLTAFPVMGPTPGLRYAMATAGLAPAAWALHHLARSGHVPVGGMPGAGRLRIRS